jgi:imidazolonepropionase-like amidohydrolase
MKRAIPLLITLALLPLPPSQAQPLPSPRRLVFTRVTIIDVRGGATKRDMTVGVTDNRISEIGKAGKVRIPQEARVVDASGKYLIPGLWGMHAHLLAHNKRDSFFPLYVVNGVTAVRDMHSTLLPPEINQWREQIADGTFLGPRVIALAGPLISGPTSRQGPESRVATEAEARQAVISRKRAGVDFIKVGSQLSRDAYFAIADEAKKQRLPFVGHVAETVSAAEASEAGQRSIEHNSGVLIACSTRATELMKENTEAVDKVGIPLVLTHLRVKAKARETFSDQKARTLFERFRSNDTWVVPTLAQGHVWQYLSDGTLPYENWLKYMPRSFTSNWRNAPAFGQPTPQDISEGKKNFRKEIELIGAMRRAGVKVMAGTDANGGFPSLIPGISLHEELRLFVEAGFTPIEALQAATLDPARFLGQEKELGAVERGKFADLVLLDASPLEDIRNTQKISAVVLNGRLLDRKALDELLARAEAAANKR